MLHPASLWDRLDQIAGGLWHVEDRGQVARHHLNPASPLQNERSLPAGAYGAVLIFRHDEAEPFAPARLRDVVTHDPMTSPAI